MYEYDLISGKITNINYIEVINYQFFYRYTYDSDGRIEKIETSRDNYIWDADAQYEYYAYGPLKRISIGDDKIQGLDYVYTINGWLKAVNHPSLSSSYDPGRDGAGDYPADVFGMTLGYFDGDFKRIDPSGNQSPFNSANNNATYTNENNKYQHEWYNEEGGAYEKSYDPTNDPVYSPFASNLVNYRPLYNGSITNITYNQSIAGVSMQRGGNVVSFMYNYDELYRLTQASFDYYDATNSRWYRDGITSAYNEYLSSYTYDENGNIKTLNRYTSNDASNKSVQFDKLTYNYADSDGDGIIDHNKLLRIDDTKLASTLTTDLDDQGSGINYSYDDIGQLIGDDAEGISNIYWTPSGKVKGVTYEGGKIISFDYDALGNRIKKSNMDNASGSYITTTTYYVPNATGATMAIYERTEAGGDADLIEIPLYGSSRIGEFAPSIAIDDDAAIDPANTSFTRTVGEKKYEINDYLGNVRAVVSDVKEPSGTTYTTNTSVSNDYYPYGMLMPSRNTGEETYRFGYQGKEHDDDIKTNGNSYDFGARKLDKSRQVVEYGSLGS